MKAYLYDGSFEGMLTSLYTALRHGEQEVRVEKKCDYQPDLFTKVVSVPTDPALADRLFALIRQEMSQLTLRHVFHVYLSETTDGGTRLLPFLIKGFQLGPGVNSLMTDPTIYPVLALSRQVSRERHRLLGLLRFQEIEGGLLYARFEPDFNQTPLLAPHFTRRLASKPWIIHDIKRGLAACWDTHEWIMRDLPGGETPTLSSSEKTFQALWQRYFDHIAIRERMNPRLQRNFMPKKYWKHLIEKQ